MAVQQQKAAVLFVREALLFLRAACPGDAGQFHRGYILKDPGLDGSRRNVMQCLAAATSPPPTLAYLPSMLSDECCSEGF